MNNFKNEEERERGTQAARDPVTFVRRSQETFLAGLSRSATNFDRADNFVSSGEKER